MRVIRWNDQLPEEQRFRSKWEVWATLLAEPAQIEQPGGRVVSVPANTYVFRAESGFVFTAQDMFEQQWQRIEISDVSEELHGLPAGGVEAGGSTEFRVS